MSDLKASVLRDLLISDAVFLGVVTAEFAAGVLTGYGVLHSGPWWSFVAVFGGLALFALATSYIGANALLKQQVVSKRLDEQ